MSTTEFLDNYGIGTGYDGKYVSSHGGEDVAESGFVTVRVDNPSIQHTTTDLMLALIPIACLGLVLGVYEKIFKKLGR